MSTLFIFIFLLLTFILGLFKYKKLWLLTSFFTLVSFVGIGYGFFPLCLLYFLQNYKEPHVITWEKSNAIIVLGAGTSKTKDASIIKPSLMAFSRITAAAQLYRRCKSYSSVCHILISGGDPRHHGKPEAATYRDTLIALGINRTDIKLESNSKNTFQNAGFTSAMLRQHPVEQTFLVSSGLTLKRALLYFSYFNAYPIPIPSDFVTIPLTKFPLGYNLVMSDFAVHEIIGIARFYVYNFFGWKQEFLR
ncbi:MAG: YdcF family protein [Rickettsia endosymbiont of Ixodes persulcatus]|nr:YdcF family protein [Rickettsia endosymbiont of Ixodes persulcatus]